MQWTLEFRGTRIDDFVIRANAVLVTSVFGATLLTVNSYLFAHWTKICPNVARPQSMEAAEGTTVRFFLPKTYRLQPEG